jgi:predicted permease
MKVMAESGLLSSFLAAIQASCSVLLVIFYGGLAAKWKLLDNSSGKAISKVCVKFFLPALLLTKIGSELHAGSADRYVVILIWAFFCHIGRYSRIPKLA